jgi:hypothetical protein
MGASEAQATIGRSAGPARQGPALTPEQLVDRLHAKVMAQLSQRPWSWRQPRSWFRRTSPELRKVLVSLPEALDELRRLLGRRAESNRSTIDEATTARLTTLLSVESSELDLDGAWQLLEGVQLMYLTVGAHDRSYVRSLLEVEQGLEGRADSDWEEPWPYYGWGRARWRQVFPTVAVEDVLAQVTGGSTDGAARARDAHDDQDAALASASERLQRLFRARVENGRKRRARLALRNRFLWYSLVVLAPLAVALTVLTHMVGDDLSWSEVVLVAVAGAVGGTVSGTLKLRGMIRITQFRLVGAGLVVQPFISAVGALFIAFVLLGGLVNPAGTDQAGTSWAVVAAYGFIAGFSEPFWLGVVSKIAGAAADDTSDS